MCKNNLFGSSYLPPDYVELTEPKRTIDPCFWAFQMRVRNATEEELPEIKAECKKRFRAQGPFEMTICLSHAKRRRLNDGQKKRRPGDPVYGLAHWLLHVPQRSPISRYLARQALSERHAV